MRAQREVQLALRSYYISAAPQILFIYMAAAPCAAGGLIIKVSRRGQQTLLKRSCYSEVRYSYYRTSELQSRTPPLIRYNIMRRGRIQN